MKNLCFQIIWIMAAAFLFCVDGAAQPGSFDQTFGTGGISNAAVSGCNFSVLTEGMAIQADGKIIAGVNCSNGDSVLLVRFNQNGGVDTSFGENGMSFTSSGGQRTYIRDMKIQPDGKIVVAGWKVVGTDNNDIFVFRYLPSGALDDSFGTGGKVFTDNGSSELGSRLAIQPDGKIVVAGAKSSSQSQSADFMIVRYLPTGAVDASFGNGGFAVTDFDGSRNSVSALEIQPDGKIAAAGFQNNWLAAARYNTDGSLDGNFGTGGKVTVELPDATDGSIARDMALQPDGKILIVGSVRSYFAQCSAIYLCFDAAVYRFTTTGALDASFGAGGKVVTPIGLGEQSDSGESIVIQPDGKIIVAGNAAGAALIRYHANGTLDKDFDFDGRFNTQSDFTARTAGATLLPDGKLILAGVRRNSSATIATARFLTGGTPPPRRVPFDFDKDLKADFGVIRRLPDGPFVNSLIWYIQASNAGYSSTLGGTHPDKPAPADYDGDGDTEIAMRVANTSNPALTALNINGITSVPFGSPDDIAVAGDFDGDGRDDFAVYRDGSQTGGQSYFFYRPSTTGAVNFVSIPWGAAGDKPVAGDFDGDGRTDAAVFRPSNGAWYALRSSDNSLFAIQFGIASDRPAPADYDGDGRTDPAVYRGGDWYVQRSTAGFLGLQFGIASDTPAPADYDGDGKTDICVFRSGMWYYLRSADNSPAGFQFGINGDLPISSIYVR